MVTLLNHEARIYYSGVHDSSRSSHAKKNIGKLYPQRHTDDGIIIVSPLLLWRRRNPIASRISDLLQHFCAMFDIPSVFKSLVVAKEINGTDFKKFCG